MAAQQRRGGTFSGRAGEELAQNFLEREGYLLIDVNVHFGKKAGIPGELDIVAWEGATLCFIEVKTRRDTGREGAPAAAVSLTKQRQMIRLATRYAVENGLLGDGETSMRFDVVSILVPGSGQRPPRIDLLRGAFLVEEGANA